MAYSSVGLYSTWFDFKVKYFLALALTKLSDFTALSGDKASKGFGPIQYVHRTSTAVAMRPVAVKKMVSRCEEIPVPISPFEASATAWMKTGVQFPGAYQIPQFIDRFWLKFIVQIICHCDVGTSNLTIHRTGFMAKIGRYPSRPGTVEKCP